MAALFNFAVVFIVLHCFTHVNGAPSFENCPYDSIEVDGVCKCNPDVCEPPSCIYTLNQITNGTDQPGDCCPTYSCDGCPENELLDGKCPCAAGAILSPNNKCKCLHPEKSLINGTCTCDIEKCPLPQVCSDNSVLVHTKIENGCCDLTECITCPEDSFSSNYRDIDIIEDKCVCYPCENEECAPDQTPKIIRPAKSIPGQCCALITCESKVDAKPCQSDDKTYNHGESWVNPDGVKCTCQNGIFLCEESPGEKLESCHDVKGNNYQHNETWKIDECTKCICNNGKAECLAHQCQQFTHVLSCPPLKNCDLSCQYGYDVDKNGCDVCTCKESWRMTAEGILRKYNVSHNDLIHILDELKHQHTSSSTTSTSVPSTTSPSTVVVISDKANSTESMSTLIYLLVGIAVGIVMAAMMVFLLIFFKRRNRKSFDVPYKYEVVNDNNNYPKNCSLKVYNNDAKY